MGCHRAAMGAGGGPGLAWVVAGAGPMGCWGLSAVYTRYMNRMARHKEDSGKIFMFGSWWFQRLSVSLQVGNARVIQERALRDVHMAPAC